MANETTVIRARESVLATNKVIRNTYILLSMTLIFSALTAGLSMFLQMPPMTYLISIGAAFLLIFFVMPKVANSTSGIGVVFLITGLLGFGLGPILNMYMSLANGPQIIATALAGTGVIFLGLSGYALMTQKDFSFMGGFLVTGILVVLLAAIGNLFFAIPALSLAISSAIIFIMAGFILYDTSRMIHDPNTNYVMATIGLYMTVFNIFINLLAILGIMGGDD